MHRRQFLGVTALLAACPAWAVQQRLPEVWSGHEAADGTIAARRGATIVKVRLGKELAPHTIDIFATDNANTQFRVWVQLPRHSDDEWAYLTYGGAWWAAESMGHDDTGSQASFVVDWPAAARLAAPLRLAVARRGKLDGGLGYTWSIPTVAATTGAIEVRLRVDNAGPATVGFALGGRQRGPRDNRFAFAITRDDQTAMKIIDAPDFGGLMTYKSLAPGEHVEVACDLRSWARLDVPGTYTIAASYGGELSKDGVMPRSPRDEANLWDILPATQAQLTIVRR